MTDNIVDAGGNVKELIDDLNNNQIIEQFEWNDTEVLITKEV